MQKKKLIIVGGGISGLTCGIYALDNDFDVEIYEKHVIAGGECTGWYRDGVYIDGCAHWIVGTNKNSDFYPVWYHLGALNEHTKIYECEYFQKFKIGDEVITFYADLNKLYDELMRIAPEDKKVIKQLIKRILDYQHTRVPLDKPLDMLNPFQFTMFGLHMLPMLSSYIKSRNESLEDFAKKAKNETLKKIIMRVLTTKDYNSHCFFYTMHALSKGDAGVPEGGSLKMANRIIRTFKDKGGKLFLNTPVKEVLIENDTAKGIVLEDGTIIKGDYVVSSTDLHFTFNKLIGEKYMSKYFKKMFTEKDHYLNNSCYYLSYKVTENIDDRPKTYCFEVEPFKVGPDEFDCITARSHSFDKTLNRNCTTITVMIYGSFEGYNYVKSLSKEEYKKFKNDLAEFVRTKLKEEYKLNDSSISTLDVATPLTYERYTNAYCGSYMSFIGTKYSKGLIAKNYVKGLKNFALCGQWMMLPGGLPIAVFSGKHAAVRVCAYDKRKFINKEEKKAKFYLVPLKKSTNIVP